MIELFGVLLSLAHRNGSVLRRSHVHRLLAARAAITQDVAGSVITVGRAEICHDGAPRTLPGARQSVSELHRPEYSRPAAWTEANSVITWPWHPARV